jgi:hypothetical protein
MKSPARAMRVLLAGVAMVAGLGAVPGPRGNAPKVGYEDMPGPPAGPAGSPRRSLLLDNEGIRIQREEALQGAIALEKTTDRAARLAELDAWTQRIHGRFRIEGEVQSQVASGPEAGFATRLRKGRISGVADCAGIGEGPGLQCILNATWPVIDALSMPAGVNMILPRSPTESLRTFGPALLVLGVDRKLLEVTALLVTDDTMTHSWAGQLVGNTLTAGRLTGCPQASGNGVRDTRCLLSLQVTAEPGSDVVSLHFRGGALFGLELRRDPQAVPEKPVKTRKVR